MKFTLLISILASSFSFSALADNLPASGCQIFIKAIEAQAGSHNSADTRVKLKVNWLGNGEQIQAVGFYSHQQAFSEGNDPSCNWSFPADGGWTVRTPGSSQWGPPETELGEYIFTFPIRTGAVVSSCNGYHFATIGTFFVQTNKNTYWLNPGMDKSQYFDFDQNGYKILEQSPGMFLWRETSSNDMKYFNPISCK